MAISQHNPPQLFPPYRNYAHAVEVTGNVRTLDISGLNGYEQDGTTMPATFDEQADIVWRNLEIVLTAAEMSYEDLVSLRFFLAEPGFDSANVRILSERLGDHRAARTV